MQTLLHNLFEECALNYPDAQALISGEGRLSYRELDMRANQLAAFLDVQGVTAGKYVRIFLYRSIDLITAILAVLKCGAAYVPLEPTYPSRHIGFLLDDLDASLLITNEELLSFLPDITTEVVCIDLIASQIRNFSADSTSDTTSGDSTAVVLYTSGST